MDDRGAVARIAAIVLVRNEDVFVEQAIRNVTAFCDRIHVADHMSSDATWDVVARLAREYDHVEARRVRHAGASHRMIERYAGTDTWIVRVDGDELYDPAGLARLRRELLSGAHRDVFRIAASGLNCVELDWERRLATGYLAPPSRPGNALYNFAAIDAWTGCPERLHGGAVAFRPGYGWEAGASIAERVPWDESPLRCLHVCFLRRSSRDPENVAGRPNLSDRGIVRRGRLADLVRRVRGPRSPLEASAWKQDKYRRGELVTKDASPFLAGPAT